MKYLFSIFSVALFALTLQAQTTSASSTASAAGNAQATISRQAAQTNVNQTAGTAAQAGQASAQANQATQLSAELTKSIDTRHAKVGDKVLARTTRTAHLADGIKLPRGTRLVGHVTRVHARSRADHSAQLAFAFDRAILRHGRSIPIHAVLTSVSAPSAMATADAMSDMDAGPAGGGMAAPAPAPARGGLLGGGAAGGALHSTGGMVGHATSVAGNGLASADRMGSGMANDVNANAIGDVAAGAHAMGTLNGTPVPVAHLPGVTLSSSSDSAASGTFHSSHRNFSLDSGTQMMMNVTVGDSGAAANGSAGGSVQ